jgi:exodeoxyribonuclease V gamma subunit
MSSKRTSYLSNKHEELAELLKENLFSSKEVFSHAKIIVPNKKTKNWLQLFLAKNNKNKVCMGLEFIESYNLINFLSGFIDKSFPDKLNLRLRIEWEIRELINNQLEWNLEERKLFSPLLEYLCLEKDYIWSKKNESRLLKLCDELVQYFFSYGIYDSSVVEVSGKKSWQNKIWENIFFKNDLSYPLRSFLQKIEPQKKRLEIHVFNISFIPPICHHFLDRLSNNNSIFDYILSPCQMFWEDIPSDFEKRAIEKALEKSVSSSKEELKEYISDRNPLLGNFGRLAREYSKLYEEQNFLESFISPASEKETLINILQKDFLFRINPEKISLRQIDIDDDSIQIHQASSKLREIEILYDNICMQLETNKNANPKDFLVLAPNISEYVPFIQMIFAENKIDYKISDLDSSSYSCFSSAITQFFSLLDGKWEKKKILDLFENASFGKKQEFSFVEKELISTWIDKANIKWGLNSEHKKKHLETSLRLDELFSQTWEYGLERILYGFVVEDENSFCNLNSIPVSGLEFSQSEIFDKFLFLFRNMVADISFLEKNPLLSLEEHEKILRKIYEGYFFIDEEKREEKKASSYFKGFLENLINLSYKLKGKKFHFRSILSLLLKHMQKKTGGYGTFNINAVSFSSFSQGIAPSSFVYLIGMEETFPSFLPTRSLDLLKKNTKSFCPNNNDILRHAFLEVILAVRKNFYISYSGFSSDGSELSYSFFIEELLSYINKYFNRDNKKALSIIKHPFLSFDKSYWQGTASSFFSNNYLSAKSYYQKKIEKKGSFFTSLREKKEDITINIKDLKLLASHPIKFYFNHCLGIYLERDLLFEKKEQEDLFFSPLSRYLLREESLTKDKQKLFLSLEKKGEFPHGIMGEVVKQKIDSEISEMQDNIDLFGVSKGGVFSLHFQEGCKKARVLSNNDWELPALEFEHKKTKIKVVGELKNISSEGILFYSDDKAKNRFKIWPEFLLYCQFCSIKNTPMKVLFTKTGKSRSLGIKNTQEALMLYLQFYMKAKSNLFPIERELLEAFLLIDKEKLKKDRKRSFVGINQSDPYLSRFYQFNDNIEIEKTIKEWHPLLSKVFAPLRELE